MNKPEPRIESLRNLLPKTEAGSPHRQEDDFVPRYVEVPGRGSDASMRNLKWGAAMLVLALILLGVGVFFGGARAVVPLLICIVTVIVLWVAARLHLFHQRNGLFLALSVVSLLGALVPILEHAWRMAALRVRVSAVEQSAPFPSAPDAEPASEEQPPLLTRELGVPAPTNENEQIIKVLKDSRVQVEGKSYLIKAGELFPFDSMKNGEVVFRANELRLSLPEDAVKMIEPAAVSTADSSAPPRKVSASTAQATQRAQQEAVRRYPALAEKDSPENKIFVETYRDLKESKSELLDDPQWPLVIADLLAKREGWERH